MDSKITIAIADDELLFRQGLISILSKEKNLDILFDAQDGNDLMAQLRSSTQLPELVTVSYTHLTLPTSDLV